MQIQRNILIIKSVKDDFERFFLEHMQTTNISTQPIYKFSSGFGWVIQIIWIEILHLPFQQIWYGAWKKEISNYDTVIVFDRNLGWSIIPYLKKKNGNRIIAWYWNIVKKPFPKKYLKYCEVWSFDEEDCKKYGYRKNVQFYFKNIMLNAHDIEYDAIFVGKDKNRYDILKKMNSEMQKQGLNTCILIIKDNTSYDNTNELYAKEMSYVQILDLIARSKCIIDVQQDGQTGITIRVLEALFFKKKLITTDKLIHKKNCLDKKNIYIWGDECKNVMQFINEPYCDDSLNTEEKMSFESWIENFYL